MKTKKITVDLGNVKLTDAEMESLLEAVHKTVNEKLKNSRQAIIKKLEIIADESSFETGTATKTATITAIFTNVDPGLSSLKASFNGATKELTQSGTLSFDGVASGDIISIQGKSLGTAEISIDIDAIPKSQKFKPGTFNFDFFIL
ncbi:MAG: hypothetical protein ABIX01_22690 [Chitinophagaceae bacterium]